MKLPIVIAYLWIIMILFGAIVLETFMVYPNVFADSPHSLTQTIAFFSVSGPSDFFPPLGFVSWLLGAGALLLCWRQRDARWWIVLSIGAMLCEGVASILYFWPRNEIMFVEGLSVHHPEYLVQVAHEFQMWHWRSRMGFNGLAAVAAFVAFLRVYRARVLEQPAESTGPDQTHDHQQTHGRGVVRHRNGARGHSFLSAAETDTCCRVLWKSSGTL